MAMVSEISSPKRVFLQLFENWKPVSLSAFVPANLWVCAFSSWKDLNFLVINRVENSSEIGIRNFYISSASLKHGSHVERCDDLSTVSKDHVYFVVATIASSQTSKHHNRSMCSSWLLCVHKILSFIDWLTQLQHNCNSNTNLICQPIALLVF